MKQKTLITLIFTVLVIILVVQAFQLNGLKEKVNSGDGLKLSTASGSTPVASSGSERASPVPKSIQNLPQMVGGC